MNRAGVPIIIAILVLAAWPAAVGQQANGAGSQPAQAGASETAASSAAMGQQAARAGIQALQAGTAQAATSRATLSGADTELDQARSLASGDNPTQAEKILRGFLREHADSAEAHFLLGYTLFREIQVAAGGKAAMRYKANESLSKLSDSNARASLAEYTAGARYHTPSAFDLKIVAYDYVLLDDFPDADKWMARSVQWNPTDADGWYSLGRIKYNLNRFEEAIHAFQECLQIDPRNVKAEYNLGLSYYGLGRANEALAAYKTAAEWEKQAIRSGNAVEGDPQPFIDLGNVYLDQDRPQDALPVFLEATQVAPGDAKAHEGLGKTYTHLGDLPKAQVELEKAVALVPNVASLHFMLGQVYRKEGMMDKAKAEFQRTEALNGTHSSPEKPIE
jgi:tetratricopeptide (TPR) repeat protein